MSDERVAIAVVLHSSGRAMGYIKHMPIQTPAAAAYWTVNAAEAQWFTREEARDFLVAWCGRSGCPHEPSDYHLLTEAEVVVSMLAWQT